MKKSKMLKLGSKTFAVGAIGWAAAKVTETLLSLHPATKVFAMAAKATATICGYGAGAGYTLSLGSVLLPDEEEPQSRYDAWRDKKASKSPTPVEDVELSSLMDLLSEEVTKAYYEGSEQAEA